MMGRFGGRFVAVLSVAGVLGAGGCADILGLDEFVDAPVAQGGAGGGTGGGPTGGGGATAMMCTPDETQACYTGPAGSETLGICQPGTQTCSADGTGFGTCNGEITPAIEECALSEDENCDGRDCGIWLTTFRGGGVEDFAYGADGEMYVVGLFTGNLEIGGQTIPVVDSFDAFVARLEMDGSLGWVRTYGGQFEDQFNGVDVMSDGSIVVSGGISTVIDIGGFPTAAGPILARMTPTGDVMWTLSCGGSGLFFDVAVSPSDDIVATGAADASFSCGDAQADGGGNDFVVVKVDSGGNIGPLGTWARAAGGSSFDAGYRVAVDAAGAVYVAGGSSGDIDLASMHFGQGSEDAFVVRLDQGGNFIDQAFLATPSLEYASGLTARPDGTVAIAFAFEGTVTINGFPIAASELDTVLQVRSTDLSDVVRETHLQNLFVLSLDAYEQDLIAAAAAVDTFNLGTGPKTPLTSRSAVAVRFNDLLTPIWFRDVGGSAFNDFRGVRAGVSANGEVSLGSLVIEGSTAATDAGLIEVGESYILQLGR